MINCSSAFEGEVQRQQAINQALIACGWRVDSQAAVES
jgi:hypothetical protein